MLKRLRPAAVIATVAVAAGFVLPLLATTAPAAADVGAKGGDFVSTSPHQQMLDTRSGVGAPMAKLTAGKNITVQATGVAGVPSSGVRAVLVDLTAVSPSAASYVEAWPTGTTKPSNAILRVISGVSASSSVIIDVGTGGQTDFYNSAGTLDLVAAVEGYFTTGTAGTGSGGYVPVPGARVVSTPSGIGVPKAQIAAGKSVTATLAGVAGIPSDAYAVYGTAQVASATVAGNIKAGAYGVTEPYSAMNYGTGNTTSGMMLRLSGGKVTFVNGGSAAINLYFDVEGYVSADSGHGYGYRSSPPTTLVPAQTLAGGADYDFQLSGRGGVPTQGAAAAVLSLTAVNATGTGYVRAYPIEGPTGEPNLTWDTGETPVSETLVPLGASGKIRLHNYGTTAITLYAVTRGWFDTDESHVVNIAAHAAPALLQSVSGGSVDASYVSAGGVLFHGLAAPDSLDQPQWSPVPSNLEAFTGQPSIVRLPSGNLLVSVLHANNGEVWNFQVAAGLSSWAPTYVHTGGIMASPPVSANLPDGNVVTFAVDAQGGLWLMAGTSYWQLLDGSAGLAGSPTVVTTSTGVQIVDTTPAGTVKTAGYANGTLSSWTDLGGVGVTDKTAAVVNNGPRVRVVARQSDGTIVSKMQGLDGVFPASWTQAGSPAMSPTFVGGPAVGIDLGSGTNPGTGKAFLLARSVEDGYLYQVDETSEASGVWSEWYQVPGQSAPAGTDATVTPFGGGANNFHWVAAYLDSNATPHLLHASVV
jgi:hypothetical protein